MEQLLEDEILRYCKIPRSFTFLSSNLFGCDLSILKNMLDSLVRRGVLSHIGSQYILQRRVEEGKSVSLKEDFFLQKYMGHFDFLKRPHPLDYEWRNSTKTLDDICDFILNENLDEDPILILGMPTLFARLYHRDVGRKVVLFERNKPIVEALKGFRNERFDVREADISTVKYTNDEQFFSVFMDPPWYSDSFKSFIWLAAKCVGIGGLIHISIPSINTRPGISSERIEWLKYCHNIGLCIEELKPQALEYVMPFFEFNAYRAAGITEISPFWRKGDLLVFRKLNHVNLERPSALIYSDDMWKEIEMDNVRIRIDLNSVINEETQTVEIDYVVQNDILDSVSRRDLRRKNANIWTSGNRVYKTSSPNTLFQLLTDYRLDNGEIDSKPNVGDIHEFISNLVNLENREYSVYLKWLYNEMERSNSSQSL